MEDDFLIVPSGSPDTYCRLCLSENNIEPLLLPDGFPQPHQQVLVDLIRRHVAIGLSAPADSPCGICSTCRMMLEEFERFRERCLRCDYALTGIDRSQHGDALPFECSQCPSKFRFKSEFERHWKSFHDLFYHCEMCDAAFSTQSMLTGHAKFHETAQQNGEVEQHHCSYCPRMFSNDKQLRFHVQVLHEPKACTNEYVPPTAKRKQIRKKAKTVEAPSAPPTVSINITNPQPDGDSSNKPYECKTCRVRFHFIGSLTRHINDKHSLPKQKTHHLQAAFSRKRKSKPTPAPVAAAPAPVEEEIVLVDDPDPAPMMVQMPDLAIPTPDDPMVTIPLTLGHSILEPPEEHHPLLDDDPAIYGHLSVPAEPEYFPDLLPDCKPSSEPTPLVYPCFVMMERLDPNLIEPIPNAEIPLGKYYHAQQMQYTATTEDPIDDEFMKNYPSFARAFNSRVQCDICFAEVTNRIALSRHKQYKHGTAVHPCPYCGKTFPVKDGLDRHLPIHTNEYPHTCDECPIGFSRLGLLNKHKEKYHVPGAPPQKLFYCPYCSRAFNRLGLIKKHVAAQHQDQYVAEAEVSQPPHPLFSAF